MINLKDGVGGRWKSLEWHFEGSCIKTTSHAANADGYPRINRDGKQRTIARHLLIRRYGRLLPGLVSRHTCDDRQCINPDHILIGTSIDNVRDMDSRGRRNAAKGEKHGNSKLTEQEVREIRASTERQRVLAARYGVIQQAISQIKTHTNWRSL